jgi:hypothetical protein
VRQILLMVFFLKLCYGGGFQSKLLAWLPNHYNPIIRVHAYMHRKKKHHWPRDYCHWSCPAKKKSGKRVDYLTCMWCQGGLLGVKEQLKSWLLELACDAKGTRFE